MASYSTNQFKPGLKIILNNQPYSIISNEFHKPGKGQAVMRVKVRNLSNNKVLDKTFKTGESVEEADIAEVKMQYLYCEGDTWCFMRMDDSYEQVFITAQTLADSKNWLQAEAEYLVTLWNNEAISVTSPNIIMLEVIETPPGVKGDTATGGNKPATLETGIIINVPLFINLGDKIKINTQTKEYLGRSNK